MATYALQFTRRGDFDSALSSGSISTLMNGVTNAQPSVAWTAYIKESGQTISGGVNVMVEQKSIGPGDIVLWDTTLKTFVGIAQKWLDSESPYPPSQKIFVYDSTHFFGNTTNASRYVFCGYCVKHHGNRMRIAGVPASKPWTQANSSDYAWSITTIGSFTTTVKMAGTNTTTFNPNPYCWQSTRYQEWYYGIQSVSTTYLPCTKSTWDSLVAASTNGQITVNGTTVNLADYHYDYVEFIQKNFKGRVPAASGAFSDRSGRANTRLIWNWLNSNKSAAIANASAAGYCYNYCPKNNAGTEQTTIPGLRKHEWFLGTIADVGELRALTQMWGLSWGSGYLWSSTQYSASYAWTVYRDGPAYYGTKYLEFTAVPLADLVLES